MDAVPVKLGTLTPSIRGIVGDGGFAAFAVEAEPAPVSAVGFGLPGTPFGSVTLEAADRKTCHSGSIHFHSVVFLIRAPGSALVGAGTYATEGCGRTNAEGGFAGLLSASVLHTIPSHLTVSSRSKEEQKEAVLDSPARAFSREKRLRPIQTDPPPLVLKDRELDLDIIAGSFFGDGVLACRVDGG